MAVVTSKIGFVCAFEDNDRPAVVVPSGCVKRKQTESYCNLCSLPRVISCDLWSVRGDSKQTREPSRKLRTSKDRTLS